MQLRRGCPGVRVPVVKRAIAIVLALATSAACGREPKRVNCGCVWQPGCEQR